MPDLLDVLVKNDIAVMPDLSFTFTNLLMWDDLDHVWNDAEFAYLHPDSASVWRSGNINRRSEIENHIRRDQWKYDLMQKLTREFQTAGVLQVVGTDASLPGLFPGLAVHRELTELVKAGISNFDALAIGSRNAGEFARRYLDPEVRVGLIEPGYRADFVLLDSNPLEDVRNARSVSAVAVNGRFTTKTALDAQRAQLRERYDLLRSIIDEVDAALKSVDARSTLSQLVHNNSDDSEILKSIENRINSAGYAAAFADDLERSEQQLELNTQLFDASANSWHSLAEIVDYRGDSARALQLYRKVLQIDPEFGNARQNIERIQNDMRQ
jgi:tetratricopeptide (TPR) repeat protein